MASNGNIDRSLQYDDSGGVGEALASWHRLEALVNYPARGVDPAEDRQEYQTQGATTRVPEAEYEQLTLFDPDDYGVPA